MSWTKLLRDESTLPRLHALGVNVIGLTVASDRHYGPDVALQNIREVGELIARDPRYCLVRIPADAKFARANNQLGIELNFQGVGPLGGNLARIGEFAELGVRHIGLAWNSPNDAGGSAAVAQDDGLTAFGRAAMAEMERVGILVDGAHAGYRTMMEAISCASKPFIVSHTNCAAVTEAHRNVRDDQIKACAQTGGVIGMTGPNSWVSGTLAWVWIFSKSRTYFGTWSWHPRRPGLARMADRWSDADSCLTRILRAWFH